MRPGAQKSYSGGWNIPACGVCINTDDMLFSFLVICAGSMGQHLITRQKTHTYAKKPRQSLGNQNEGQWEDGKQWSLGVGQRRKTF